MSQSSALLADDIGECAVQVNETRVFFQTARDVLRVYFIYDSFWFCMEGKMDDADTDVNISNIRTRGSFVDCDVATNSIPPKLQTRVDQLIADKRMLITPPTS